MASNNANTSNATNDVKTIHLFTGSAGQWQPTEVKASNVGELRSELEIPASSSCNVGGTVVGNDHSISDGSYVAFNSNDKTGGAAD